MVTETLCESDTIAIALPLVRAFVITYNGKRFLSRCFETIQQLTDYGNYRIVLVDNGSADGSGEYVREAFPGIDVLRVFPNVGYAHGANEAIAEARRTGAKYIVLMNDDIVILHSQWLREAVAHAERDPSIGMIGFVQVASDTDPPASATSTLTDVDYLGSAVLLIPVELFDRIGLFDEVYYVTGDEDDLGARARSAGYRLVKLGIPICHFGSGTIQTFGRRSAYLQMRNGIRFCLKNRGIVRALLRAARIFDVACNPWSLSFNDRDIAHRRMRNSGNVVVNFSLWLRAVSWNFIRLPQTLRIRAAERRLIRAARSGRKRTAMPSRSVVATAGETTYKPALMGDQP